MKNPEPAKILIVDDEPLILEVLMTALQDEGYDVDGAPSGEIALRKFQQSSFDVVITDITMAKVSGIDLLFALKEINQDVEVILITAYASVETAQAAIAGGAYRYLRKPFNDLEEVLTIVQEAVQARRKKLKREASLQEAVYQRDKLQKRLGQLETMYLISHAIGFPENHASMLKDVSSLLYKVIPINLMACLIQQEVAGIYINLFHNFKEEEIQKLIQSISQEIPKDVVVKTFIEKCSGPGAPLDSLGKLVEVTFPEQSSMKGSIWIALPDGRQLVYDEERLLEVTAAQMAGMVCKLNEFHRQERERMHTLIEGIHDGVIIISTERYSVLLANKRALELFKAEKPEDLKIRLQKLGLLKVIEEYWNKEWIIGKEIETPDGRTFSISMLPLTYPLEPAFTIVVQDLTQHYIIQKELELSRRLTCIGEMVSNVFHELNTPLTVILGYAQLLTSRKLPPDLMNDLDTICQEAQRSQKIIQNMLGLARSKSQEKVPIELSDLVEKSLELKQISLKKRNIYIGRNFPQESILIEVDPGQIQQVLLNVINNAQDAMEQQKEEKKLEIGLSKTEKTAIITIADTGTGIPESIMEKIFDPFFTTKPPGHGNGLGLSISHKILEEHKGKIKVANREGRGAVFTIEIPLLLSQQKENAYFSGLIIASRQEMVQMLSHFLKKYRVQCKIAMNEETASRDLTKQNYNIILVDFQPVMMELSKEFFANLAEKYGNKTIVLCEDTFSVKMEESLVMNHLSYLYKPFALLDLENILNKILPEAKEV